MKIAIVVLFYFLLLRADILAQPTADKIAGTYYLEGVSEVGSGFKLTEDHQFEFFFAYGGLDRYGTGTWQLIGNNIVFNSQPWTGSDFKLERQARNKKQKGITIKISDPNTFLTGYVGCIISGDGRSEEIQTDQNGIASFNLQHADSISLYHQFYSDQLSVFPVPDKGNNFFEFTFLSHLGTVYFSNFNLVVFDTELTGGHPLLEKGKIYYYRKGG